MLVLLGEFVGGSGGERRPSYQQLVQDAAERVEVCGRRDPLGTELLGRHVAGRTDAHARAGQAGLVGIVHDRTHAEVEDLDGAVAGQHRVGRLQVAVDDPRRVRGGETGGDLRPDGGGPGDRELGLLVDEVGERMTVEQFHGQVGQAGTARCPVHTAVDEQGEVRVALGEHAHDPHFAAEAVDLLAGPRRVDGDPGPGAQDGLERDLPVRGVRGGLEILGPVHLAHVPAPQHPRDPEASVDRPQAHWPSPSHPAYTRWVHPVGERIPSPVDEHHICTLTLSTCNPLLKGA